MRTQSSINFSSVSAWGSPGQPNYGAAKHAILGLTLALANSMVKYNCTANAIVPGFVATRMTDSTPRGQQILQQTGKPMSQALKGTETDPANVAPIVVYLGSVGDRHRVHVPLPALQAPPGKWLVAGGSPLLVRVMRHGYSPHR